MNKLLVKNFSEMSLFTIATIFDQQNQLEKVFIHVKFYMHRKFDKNSFIVYLRHSAKSTGNLYWLY